MSIRGISKTHVMTIRAASNEQLNAFFNLPDRAMARGGRTDSMLFAVRWSLRTMKLPLAHPKGERRNKIQRWRVLKIPFFEKRPYQ